MPDSIVSTPSRRLLDSQTSPELDFDIAEENETLLATMEKSLGIGVQRNPVLQMQQKFCGPVVQIQRVGLIAYRSIFNLFMWSDPFASFWLLMILLGLILVTALFPWRLAFFVGGVGFVGPQVRRTSGAFIVYSEYSKRCNPSY